MAFGAQWNATLTKYGKKIAFSCGNDNNKKACKDYVHIHLALFCHMHSNVCWSAIFKCETVQGRQGLYSQRCRVNQTSAFDSGG